jgi:pseudouridylate synthase
MKKLQINPEVHAAIKNGEPVVALESTIISHGMPYPQNLEVAVSVEQAVRDQGAVPATIAVVQGVPTVGLTAAELATFAQASGIRKCSRSDIAWAVAHGLNGATTVAATMILAAMAGIRLFATGGIGGVHRGASDTMDISADLLEFTRTPVNVVAAGAKAILDLPKTLEYLDTLGVPVVGYQTDEFPAFYYRDSGLPVTMRANDPAEAVAFMKAREALQLQGGILIAQPVPREMALEKSDIETTIAQALEEAKALGISGKEVTPFLLSALNRLTLGRSQATNKALVLNNARLAAQLAVEWARSEKI